MENDTRSELLNLATQHGEKFWIDAAKCRAILNDVGKMFSKREIFALVSAASLGLPKIISNESSSTQWSVRRLQFSKTMQEDTGIQEQLALWSLDGWAIALGKISLDQLTSKTLDVENYVTQIKSVGSGVLKSIDPEERTLYILARRISVKNGELMFDFQIFNKTILNLTEVRLEFSAFDKDGFILQKRESITKNVRPGNVCTDQIAFAGLKQKTFGKLFVNLSKYSMVDCVYGPNIKDLKTIEAAKMSILKCKSLVENIPIDCPDASIFECLG